jgi:hypothetical protein
VNFVPFGEQKLGQIRSVLPGYSSDKRFLHRSVIDLPICSCSNENFLDIIAIPEFCKPRPSFLLLYSN